MYRQGPGELGELREEVEPSGLDKTKDPENSEDGQDDDGEKSCGDPRK